MYYDTIEMEWLASDGSYDSDDMGVARLPGGWMVQTGHSDFEVCGAKHRYWTCLAEKHHEHPHIACIDGHVVWENGMRITSVSRQRHKVVR